MVSQTIGALCHSINSDFILSMSQLGMQFAKCHADVAHDK